MKTIDPNDPRVTTYALGELPEAERAEFEDALRESPDAQAEVESLREMTAMLTADFAAELDENFTPTKRSAPAPQPHRWKSARIKSLGVAAVLTIGTLLTMQFVEFQVSESADPMIVAQVESKAPTEKDLQQVRAVGDTVGGSGSLFLSEAELPAGETTVGSYFGKLAPINKPHEGNAHGLSTRSDLAQTVEGQSVIGHGGTTQDGLSANPASSVSSRTAPGLPGEGTGSAGSDATTDANLLAAATNRTGSLRLTGTATTRGSVAPGAGGDISVRLDDASKLSVAPVTPNQRKQTEGMSITAGRGVAVDGTVETGAPHDFRYPAPSSVAQAAASDPLDVGRRSDMITLEANQINELISELRPAAEAMKEGEPAKNESLFDSRVTALPAVQSLGRVAPLIDNAFTDPLAEPLSTFSVDVDSASYTTIRRSLLRENRVPHPDSVRIEEMVNYFDYPSYAEADWDVEEADGEAPFSINLASASAPWDANKRIVRVGLRGAEVADTARPPLNLAFLLDVSGSMSSADKLPLMQEALAEFVPQLRREDKVTIVVYAGSSGEVLAPTAGSDHATIREALGALSAGGSTAGASGITLAYQRARENFIEDGINQVILATDGDFNVGTSDDVALVELVEKEAKSGVFLTVLGFGSGNLNDSMLEKITNQGNGQYHYIDRIEEGRRVLVEELTGTLVPIAKDVKVQVEFNPAKVASYRLIGYANRMLEAEDFADDTVDASEIGAGHTVTALYEVLPVANLMQVTEAANAPDLKYQKPSDEPKVSPFEARQKRLADRGLALTETDEWLTVKLRYKKPKEDVSVLVDRPMVLEAQSMDAASDDLRFATAVAAFGMTLRGNADVGVWGLENVLALAKSAADDAPERAELITMIERAMELTGEGSTAREVKEKLEAIR